MSRSVFFRGAAVEDGGCCPKHQKSSAWMTSSWLMPYLYSTCADPNGGNNYKSLRANSCDHCAELCRLTGGCNYWTWVPHFLEPNGHRHCKLYKNFCCFKYFPFPVEKGDGSQIRKSGS